MSNPEHFDPALEHLDPSAERFSDTDDAEQLWVVRAASAVKDSRVISDDTYQETSRLRQALEAQGFSDDDIRARQAELVQSDLNVRAKNELLKLLMNSDRTRLQPILAALADRAANYEREIIASGVNPDRLNQFVDTNRIEDDFLGLLDIYRAGKEQRTD